MQDWAEIRHLHFAEGLSARAIASRLGLASCLLRMGLAVRAANPSRRLLIEGEGGRGGEEDEAEEKESSLWGRMRTMATDNAAARARRAILSGSGVVAPGGVSGRGSESMGASGDASEGGAQGSVYACKLVTGL